VIKIMKKSTLLFALTIVTSPLLCQNVIPFTRNKAGHILVPATVEGIPGTFIFDTGGGTNLYFTDFAKKFQRGSTHNFFVGHRSTGEEMRVPVYGPHRFEIGGRKFEKQIYSTYQIEFEDIDGLISLLPFENETVIIDYERSELSIRKLSEKEKKNFIPIQIAKYEGKALDIFTNIRLNDTIVIQVLLDSGAGTKSYWLDRDLAKYLGMSLDSLPHQERKSDFVPDKSTMFYRGKIRRISTENRRVSLDSPTVNFVEGLIYEGKVSIEWLGKKIAISIPDKRIYLLVQN
jgi:hypothetical protein